jgi:hypothetical protein
MAKSKLKTNLSILRQELGELGNPIQFSELIGVSRSWITKASCGQIPINAKAALIIAFKTGYSPDWIQGIGSKKFGSGSKKKYINELVKKFREQLCKTYGITK